MFWGLIEYQQSCFFCFTKITLFSFTQQWFYSKKINVGMYLQTNLLCSHIHLHKKHNNEAVILPASKDNSINEKYN